MISILGPPWSPTAIDSDLIVLPNCRLVRSEPVLLRSRGQGRASFAVLMPSTPFAYPQVVSRCFASSIPLLSQLKSIFEPGSIPGSSTTEDAGRCRFVPPVGHSTLGYGVAPCANTQRLSLGSWRGRLRRVAEDRVRVRMGANG